MARDIAARIHGRRSSTVFDEASHLSVAEVPGIASTTPSPSFLAAPAVSRLFALRIAGFDPVSP